MKPTFLDVMPHILAVYKRHCAGCCLHVLVDDGNLSQEDADFCLEQAQKEGHADCLAAAEMLAQMSRTQRRKVFMDGTKYGL